MWLTGEVCLIRVDLTAMNDSYQMVRKLRVHFWDFIFGHMATGAVRCCFRAGCRGPGRSAGCGFMYYVPAQGVTTQTLLIIESGIPNQRLMRVVTCSAGKSSVLCLLPAATLLQAIRLEADAVGTVRRFIQNDIHRGSMTGPTEIDRACWREMDRVQNCFARFIHLTGRDCIDVVAARPMTGFAMDSGYGICEVESETV